MYYKSYSMHAIHTFVPWVTFDISNCGNYTWKDYTNVAVHALIFDDFSFTKIVIKI